MLLKTIVSAAFVTAIALPAAAQEPPDPLAPPPSANDDVAPGAGAMSPEQQAEYAAWPLEVRDYYDSLSPERQSLFWQMDDADKVSLASMSPQDQEAVWQGIEALPGRGASMPKAEG